MSGSEEKVSASEASGMFSMYKVITPVLRYCDAFAFACHVGVAAYCFPLKLMNYDTDIYQRSIP